MRVEISGGKLLLDGKDFYLRGGEIHYFRLNKPDWKNRVSLLKETKMNTVSTYMPWFWHEESQGEVDIDGRTCPEKDLRGFLDICSDAGVKVIAKPGPFVNSELRFGGYPQWVFEQYPETMSRRADGKVVTGRTAPAEGEPVLRGLVKRWYAAVVPLLAEYSAENGGPVILFQPDNELSAAWTFGFTNSLYDPSVIGENGFWHRWLEEKYGGLAALSERYGATLESWPEVVPPVDLPETLSQYRRSVDWLDFKRSFFADWGITLCRWANEFGLNLPFVFNEPVAGFYTHGDHTGFGRKLKESGLKAFTVCHTYADRISDIQGPNSFEIAIELVKASSAETVPMSVESNHTWFAPRFSRHHANASSMFRLGLAHGLNGSSVYPFVSGKNPEGSTLCGLEYWEDAPVSVEGSLNPSHKYLFDFYSFVSGWETQIMGTVKKPDIVIGISPAIRYIPFMGSPFMSDKNEFGATSSFQVNPEPGAPSVKGGHEWLGGCEGVTLASQSLESLLWNDFTELIILLRRMNILWGLVDLANPNIKPGNYTLVVPSAGFLEGDAIGYIKEHLQAGGDVMFFPTVPYSTLDGEPDSSLTDMLKVVLKDKIRPAGGEILDYGWRIMKDAEDRPVGHPSWIVLHEGTFVETFASFRGEPVVTAVKGGDSKVVLSGVSPYYGNSSHIRLWESVFRFLGVVPQASSEGGYMNIIRRRNTANGSVLVTLANILGEETGKKVLLSEEGLSFPKNCDICLDFCEARMLWAFLPLDDNCLVYITHELTPVAGSKEMFQVRGRCGDVCEVAFKENCKLWVDGESLELNKKEGLFIGNFRFMSASAVIKIKN